MQYMLQIYGTDAMASYEELSEEEKQSVMAEYLAISQMPGVTGGARMPAARMGGAIEVRPVVER